MFFILFVLHDVEKLHELLSAWETAGVSGVTVLPSTGMKRILEKGALRDDLPLIPSLDDLLQRFENTNRTLFSIVEDEALVERAVAATQDVLGSLDEPNTGILAVLPVARAYGLRKPPRS